MSPSAKQRGKAPPVDYSFGSIRAYRQQFTGTVTPPSQIHGQSTNRTELKPERRDVLRRDPPPRKPTKILDGVTGHCVGMPTPPSRCEIPDRVEPVRFF